MLKEKVWIFQLWIRKVSPHCRHTSLFYALCVCWRGGVSGSSVPQLICISEWRGKKQKVFGYKRIEMFSSEI